MTFKVGDRVEIGNFAEGIIVCDGLKGENLGVKYTRSDDGCTYVGAFRADSFSLLPEYSYMNITNSGSEARWRASKEECDIALRGRKRIALLRGESIGNEITNVIVLEQGE